MKNYTRIVESGRHLQYEEMVDAANQMFSEDVDVEELAAFLVALSRKGETAKEVAAIASVMTSHAVALDVPAARYLDNCGTGGDGSNSFNISTTSAFVLAGAGVKVAKHGNRKISSAAGSQDALDALGIHSRFTPEDMSRMLRGSRDYVFIRTDCPSENEKDRGGAPENREADDLQSCRTACQSACR